ncbi:MULTISPECIES: hypothetical protein [Vibrio]|uniref:hypothetical protein n=1 Tax=Vibrio TaxID=662 RepID=UPI000721F267|nr:MULTISPECIES: hypothetical protein [Vibrio]ALR94618.1 hypothetical protein AT730_20130 [Vibrio alginolyticus]ELA8347484.1 hypothetical protein [Vibrio alginolyticus]ELA8468836.1 hypothetical protein [Vibrio alginolyticus]MBO0198540.1 hypothetical protein [Vibrio alginolyticus]MBS9973694.1 hypothetical protein [Vibrio alginolyticus]
MNNSRWVGFIGGTIVLLSTFILFGSSVHSAWYRIPAEAIHGIAFTLAFGLGLNSLLAYATAVITLAALFYIGFVVSYRAHQKLK